MCLPCRSEGNCKRSGRIRLKMCFPLSIQDPSFHGLWSFPFLPQHVVDCSNIFLQPLWNYTGVSLLYWFPGILHPFVCAILVSELVLSVGLLFWYIHYYILKPKYRMQPIFYLHIIWPFTVHFMVYNHGSFLPGSVVMCYFITLASVYGKSVAMLRAQLKLVSCWHLPKWCSV